METDEAGEYVCFHARTVLKILLGAFILVCFALVLLIASVSSSEETKESSAGSISLHGSLLVSSRRVHLGHHFIYVSKRRVPNGPDPIHNRRVGESRRPPGRA